MKTRMIVVVSAVSALLSGCWTISETEFQTVTTTPAPAGKKISVKLQNYRTGVYNYIPVENHETMDADSNATSGEGAKQQKREEDQTTSWGLQNSASGRLLSRSIAELKRKGYAIDHANPQYIIELTFEGPEYVEWEMLRQLGYMICTIFTMEKNEVTWRAHLTVFDSTGEKALMQKDYEQNYLVRVWGPIPIGSPACNVKATDHAANSWVLTALSDQALADATAFIAGQKK